MDLKIEQEIVADTPLSFEIGIRPSKKELAHTSGSKEL